MTCRSDPDDIIDRKVVGTWLRSTTADRIIGCLGGFTAPLGRVLIIRHFLFVLIF